MDYSQGMLDIAKENAKSIENKESANIISWLQSDACTMTLPERSFDRAYCREGLQFMPDAKAACELTRKALKPGAVLTASCKAPAGKMSNPMFAAFRDGMLSVGKVDWANMLGMPTCWADSDEAGVEKFKTCFAEAGFEGISVVVEDVPCSLPSMERVFAIVTALPFGDELVGDPDLFGSFKSVVQKELLRYVDDSTGAVTLPVRAIFAQGTAPKS